MPCQSVTMYVRDHVDVSTSFSETKSKKCIVFFVYIYIFDYIEKIVIDIIR